MHARPRSGEGREGVNVEARLYLFCRFLSLVSVSCYR